MTKSKIISCLPKHEPIFRAIDVILTRTTSESRTRAFRSSDFAERLRRTFPDPRHRLAYTSALLINQLAYHGYTDGLTEPNQLLQISEYPHALDEKASLSCFEFVVYAAHLAGDIDEDHLRAFPKSGNFEKVCQILSKKGKGIVGWPANNPDPGTLIFLGCNKTRKPVHVGIYLDHKRIIHLWDKVVGGQRVNSVSIISLAGFFSFQQDPFIRFADPGWMDMKSFEEGFGDALKTNKNCNL